MWFGKNKRRSSCKKRSIATRLSFEHLEEKRLLAIVWSNQFGTGSDDPEFNDFYGANEAVARQLVNRAIADWNKVILDQDWDNDSNPATNGTFGLKVFARDLGGSRGTTDITSVSPNTIGFTPEVPTAATIEMDDDGGGVNDQLGGAGDGWFFDQTPLDDAEFTAIVNSGENGTGAAFQATFVDVTAPGQNDNDFYRTIVHEIGHALGILLHDGSIDPTLDRLFLMTTDIGDDPKSTNQNVRLRTFSGSAGTVTFTTDGGGHTYEGNINDAPAIVSHPNDLLNPGRVVPVDPPPPPVSGETTRQFISDLNVQLLADAYGYTVVLPSTLNTAHVTLDSLTGTLLVQGGVTSAGVAQTDSIVIDTVGSDIRVRLYSGAVNYATERVPAANVTQIVVSRAGDNISDPNSLLVRGVSAPVHHVYSVVSSNQDAIDTGSLSDGFVDLNSVVPGAQVTLRAAVQNSNGLVGGSVYLPRGRYRLTLAGSGADAQGDLDISKTFNLFGTGAGQTIIDAGGDTGILDRVFEVDGLGSVVALTLNSLTVTGGRAPNASSYESHGGGIFVRDGTTLHLNNSAIVDNKTTSDMGIGGGIFFAPPVGHTITNSVITANHSSTYTGGVYLFGITSTPYLRVTASIIAENTAAQPGGIDVGLSPGRMYTSGGNNLLGNSAAGFSTATGDYIKPPGTTIHYIVTGLADKYDGTTDKVDMTLRDAISLANSTAGTQEIWVPAWRYLLTMAGSGGVTQGDFDITSGTVTIRGIGAGLSIIDAGRLTSDDRVIDVENQGVLNLSRVTLTLGDAPSTAGQHNGGAIRVQDGGQLNMSFSAIVGNDTGKSGKGGGIYFSPLASGSIEASVIAVNTAHEDTGGVYLEGSIGTGGSVSLKTTMIANNSPGETYFPDVVVGSGRTLNSLGDNRLTSDGGFTPHATDYFGPVNYVVTSVADTYDGTSDVVNMSVRDAIHQANITAGVQEIWLPAWKFVLNRDRATYGVGTTDTSVEFGDLDISDSLTFRGVAGLTGFVWRADVVDAVLELLGDYDDVGTTVAGGGIQYSVTNSDLNLWQATQGTADLRADGDDDGDVDAADQAICSQNLGDTLTLFGV
jgi:hypothetical protein